MSDARRHGIQAYKGHSKYVRGKKIKVDIPQPEPSQELELSQEISPPEEPVRSGPVDAEPVDAEPAEAEPAGE